MSIDRFTRLYNLYTKKKNILIRSSIRVFLLVLLIGISSITYAQTVGGMRPSDDFDGDGIINSIDLDDDNDGILDTDEYCKSSIQLPATNSTAAVTEFSVPAGWTITNSSPDIATTAYSIYSGWVGGCSGTAPAAPNGHRSWVNFYSNTQEAFKTNIAGLTVGKTYILKVYYAKFAATAALGQITVKLGTTIIDQYRPTLGCGWETRFITFTATATSADLQFQNTGIANPMQNASISVSADALYEVCDTDNDGIPNQFDLDSDGDGCPDAKEAGVTGTLRNGDMKNGANGGVVTTTVSTAGAIAGASNTYGANGLADALETVAESGIINYTSYYSKYALSSATNICSGLDTDGDGIVDVMDLDDDNDGVLDLVECPPVDINYISYSPLTYSVVNGASASQTFPAAPNGLVVNVWSLDNSFNIKINGKHLVTPEELEFSSPTTTNSVFEFLDGTVYASVWTVNGSQSKPLIRVYIDKFGAVKVFGSKTSNGNLEEMRLRTGSFNTVTLNTTTTNIFEIGQQVIGPTYITGDFGVVTTNCDFDGDGIPNDLDSDSDNDGCSDAYEAKTTTDITPNYKFTSTNNAADFGANGFYNALETATDNGIYKSNYSYDLAIDATLKACLDSDGDGVLDVFDLDDDNDGVLDTVEYNCTASIMSKTGVSVSSTVTWGATLANILDGTESIAAYTTTTFLNQTILQFDLPAAKALSLIELSSQAGNFPLGSTGTYNIEGWNATTSWKTIATNQVFSTSTPITGTSNSYKFNMPNNYTAYSKYRIYGTSVSGTVSGWVQEAYFTERICNSDTDGDGIANHLDLDSDGDGCTDAVEAGVNGVLTSGNIINLSTSSGTSTTTTNIASAIATGTYGANGLADGVETSAETGVVSYNNKYSPYALSKNLATCKDSDGDGVLDNIDLDDDNDGILDALESPTCFMSADEWNTIDKTISVNITSGLNTLSPNNKFSALTDNDEAVAAVQFSTATAQTQNSKEIFKVEFLSPTQLDALYIQKTTATEIFAATVSSLKLQGSNDNSSWTDLTDAITRPANGTNITANGAVSLTNSNKFTITKGAGKFKYYRIYGFIEASILAGIASEFYFDVNNTTYQASNFPKTTCTTDTDGDGIPNHLDLDSDGDGCPDAKEAGINSAILTPGTAVNLAGATIASGTSTSTIDYAVVATIGGSYTSTFGNNGFANALETSTESGKYSGTYTYSNVIDKSINTCSDADGDGVLDILDLDDDNDGVLDKDESCKVTTATSIALVGKTYSTSKAASFGDYLPAVTTGLDASTTFVFGGPPQTQTYNFTSAVTNPIVAFYGVD